jgi:hypothetical protein
MLTMPRKKKAPGEAPNVPAPKKIISAFKGSPDFDHWFTRMSSEMRLPKSTLIEHALIAYAQSKGFLDPPPER